MIFNEDEVHGLSSFLENSYGIAKMRILDQSNCMTKIKDMGLRIKVKKFNWEAGQVPNKLLGVLRGSIIVPVRGRPGYVRLYCVIGIDGKDFLIPYEDVEFV
ncbi:hypothetical protein [Bacillus haynesii]|uniref:hypothetical protein n=1 Tax=Bacillus TaxID=1386 RepID=UPI0035D929A4